MVVPRDETELTPAWLSAALEEGGALAAARVIRRRVEPLGQGLYSRLLRVHLVYDRAEEAAPHTLIAKLSSPRPEMRRHAAPAYRKEVHFYLELAPESVLPTPICYYGAMDEESAWHVLLLEDLAPAQSGSRTAGCTPEQATLAVTQIAAFHAAWWEHPRLAALAWLPDPDLGEDPRAAQAQYEGWWAAFLERLDRPLPEPIQRLGASLGPHRARVEAHLFNAPPRTLLHGDYHLGNMLFAGPAGGKPFAVVDWQLLRRGRGVRDVAYFLSENLLPEERRAVEMDLLRAYHAGLLAGGVAGYTFQACLQDYRLSLLQRFRALVSTIAAMPFTAAERQMHVDTLLPRNVAALVDHGVDTGFEALMAGRW